MANYTVKKGDNLAALAKKWGVTVSAVLDANAGVGGLGPGITLRIPNVVRPSRRRETAPPSVPSPYSGPPKAGRKRPSPTPQPQIPIPPRFQPPPGVPYSPPAPQQPVNTPVAPPKTQPPVQRADLSQYNEARRAGYVPQQPRVPYGVGQFAGVGPGGGGDYVPPSERSWSLFSNYIQRLFQSRQFNPSGIYAPARGISPPPGRGRGPQGGVQMPDLFGGNFDLAPRIAGSFVSPAPPPGKGLSQTRREIGGRYLQSSQPIPQTAIPNPLGRPGKVLPSGWMGMPPESQDNAEVDETGVIWYRMKLNDGTDSHMMNYGVSTADVDSNGQLTEKAQSKYLDQRAGQVEISWKRGEFPQIVLESDQIRIGMSDDDMLEAGYFWNDDKGLWEYGPQIGEAPQSYGAAMPYSGYGYGGGRRGGGYPRGGGGTYSPYQGYADYTEPGQRGFKPQQIQNRPGRFGMITWRI